MSLTKLERDKQKLIQDKCQQILTELLRDEDNKYCVDCDSKGPRWASWNLGIFLCIRCAGIHRNLGVHISKVKSVNLDSWTPEQVGSIQNMGNSKARAVYEANLPDTFTRPQADSSLETFIRAKYELKKYIAKEWVETTPKPAFDVEAELKREKDKKKSKIKSISPIGTQAELQSNPIPRPNTSVNGKSEKIQTQSTSTPKAESNSATTDLLGLDLTPSGNDEPFGFFASAESAKKEETVANNQQGKDPKTLEDEEKDFFSQRAPEKSEEKKLTKESILSLYSQAPSTGNVNGFLGNTVNTMNQFPSGNATFGAMNAPNQANVMASTNPFLANSANSAFMQSDFPHQQLVQGLTSLQLNTNPVPQMPLGNVQTTATGNTQGHLNWFGSGSTTGQVGANVSGLFGTNSSVANPFVDSNSTLNPLTSSSNILNFDLKPNGSTVQFPSTNTTGLAPNPLLNNMTNNSKETNTNQLANFW